MTEICNMLICVYMGVTIALDKTLVTTSTDSRLANRLLIHSLLDQCFCNTIKLYSALAIQTEFLSYNTLLPIVFHFCNILIIDLLAKSYHHTANTLLFHTIHTHYHGLPCFNIFIFLLCMP